MDYSNRLFRHDYLRRLNDLYEQRVNDNKLTDYVKMVLIIQSTSEILDHPELFESLDEYEAFMFNNPISDEVRYFYSASILPTMSQSFYNIINSQFTTQINTQRNYIYGFDGEYMLQETRRELAEFQSDQLVDYIHNRSRAYTNQLDADYNITTIAEKLTRDVERVNLVIRQQELQKDNTLRYTQEILKPEDQQKRYKTWVWNPNPQTRHSQMANTTVPLNEDFRVISDQKGCPDEYLRYPLDPRGSNCQCLNCMCTLVFTENKSGEI